MSTEALDGMDGWLRSLEHMVPTPPEHTGERVEWEEALRWLRCPEAVLAELVERGLPCEEREDGRFFERADLYNVALWSGSGRSLPELGAVFIRRLGALDVAAWTERRRWDVRIELRCPLGSECPGGPWELARPDPRTLDGSEVEWRDGDRGPPPPTGPIAASPSQRFFAIEASFETEGSEAEIVAPALREAYDMVVADYRYQVLQRGWQRDLDSLRRSRVADCVAAASLVAAACSDAGYEAKVDAGLLLGAFGFANHRWVRVRDDDGEWKLLEPTLPMLSKVAGSHDPGFARFCCGSTINRIVACEPLASGGLAEHVCGGDRREADVAIRARLAASTAQHGLRAMLGAQKTTDGASNG
jgi:hypothetical protein